MHIFDIASAAASAVLIGTHQSQFVLEQSHSPSTAAADGGGQETIRPLVIWHGMGDSFNSSSMAGVIDLVKQVNPSIPVYSIYADADNEDDQQAGIFGNLTEQMTFVCDELRNNSLTDFDAIGFSQGGLFTRSLLETCSDITINNMITFGSPHNGIYDISLCSEGDWFCKRRNALLRAQIYKPSVQSRSIQAQYFRDVNNYEEYLAKSQFIVNVNNDNVKKQIYADRLATKLKGKFVMVMFDKDTTLVPKQSAWFYDFDPVTESVLTFTETESFTKNLVGLQDLYKKNQIIFETIDAEHMRISDEFLTDIIQNFTGKTQ